MERFQYRNLNIEGILEELQHWPEVMEYYRFCCARGLADCTVDKNLRDIRGLLFFLRKPVAEMAPNDMISWVLHEKSLRHSDLSIQHKTTVARIFLRFAGRPDLAEAIPRQRTHYTIRTGIMSRKDMLAVESVCRSRLQLDLVRVMKDTGCRIGELLTLRRHDVHFDRLGCYIIVSGKTGQRAVRLMESALIMRSLYRKAPEDSSLIFGGHAYNWAHAIFQRASATTGRRIHPHMMRHTRTTEMLEKYPEAIVKKYMGWSPDSKMLVHYSHLSPHDVDAALFGTGGFTRRGGEL